MLTQCYKHISQQENVIPLGLLQNHAVTCKRSKGNSDVYDLYT